MNFECPYCICYCGSDRLWLFPTNICSWSCGWIYQLTSLWGTSELSQDDSWPTHYKIWLSFVAVVWDVHIFYITYNYTKYTNWKSVKHVMNRNVQRDVILFLDLQTRFTIIDHFISPKHLQTYSQSLILLSMKGNWNDNFEWGHTTLTHKFNALNITIVTDVLNFSANITELNFWVFLFMSVFSYCNIKFTVIWILNQKTQGELN